MQVALLRGKAEPVLLAVLPSVSAAMYRVPLAVLLLALALVLAALMRAVHVLLGEGWGTVLC